MKNNTLCLLLLLLTISSTYFAQEDVELSKSLFKISELQLLVGGSAEREKFGTLDDFKALMPNSQYLNNDLGFGNGTISEMYSFPQIFSLDLGIKMYNKKLNDYHQNRKLRIGLAYNTLNSFSNWKSTFDSNITDTLTSSQTGELQFISTETSRNYSMTYVSEQLILKMALLFNTPNSSKFSAYAGLGFTGGVSIINETSINYYESFRSGVLNNNQDYPLRFDSSFDLSESQKNKTNVSFAAEVPLGISYRINNKNEFWEHMYLFYELKPGIQYTDIPELGSWTRFAMRNGLGIRVDW